MFCRVPYVTRTYAMTRSQASQLLNDWSREKDLLRQMMGNQQLEDSLAATSISGGANSNAGALAQANFGSGGGGAAAAATTQRRRAVAAADANARELKPFTPEHEYASVVRDLVLAGTCILCMVQLWRYLYAAPEP